MTFGLKVYKLFMVRVNVKILQGEVITINIQLPKKSFVFNNGAAVVKGNILYIYRPVDFNELMYALTYAIHTEKYGEILRCHYCGAELSISRSTLDHKCPVDLGGPTIPNNLVPTCRNCNSTKGNLTEEQFKIFREFEDKDQAKAYRVSIEREHRNIKKNGTIIPKEWIRPRDYPLNVIKMRMHVDVALGHGFDSIKKKYKKYGTILRPVIVSANEELLDGFNVCLFAKTNNCWKIVTVIRLDNVVTMY